MARMSGISQKEAVCIFQKLSGERRLLIPRHDPINAITMGAIARDAGAYASAIPRAALNVMKILLNLLVSAPFSSCFEFG